MADNELRKCKQAAMDAIETLRTIFPHRETSEPYSKRPAKYVWMVHGTGNPCDIRRYAYSHREAVNQLDHAFKRNVLEAKDWTLYKLIRVNKRKAKESHPAERGEG